jgi:hypothetical protein
MGRAYDAALEAEGQGCCAVSDLDGAAGVRVVIGHCTEERSALYVVQDGLSAFILILVDAVVFLELCCRRAVMTGLDGRPAKTDTPGRTAILSKWIGLY